MRLSEYGILEDSDTLEYGDEIRFVTPISHNPEQMKWTAITAYWIGKKFGEFQNPVLGILEGRRKLNEKD